MRFGTRRRSNPVIAPLRLRRRIWPLIAIIVGLIIAISAAYLYFFRLPPAHGAKPARGSTVETTGCR